MSAGFGADLIPQIRTENPGVWTDEFEQEVRELTTDAVDLEQIYR